MKKLSKLHNAIFLEKRESDRLRLFLESHAQCCTSYQYALVGEITILAVHKDPNLIPLSLLAFVPYTTSMKTCHETLSLLRRQPIILMNHKLKQILILNACSLPTIIIGRTRSRIKLSRIIDEVNISAYLSVPVT